MAENNNKVNGQISHHPDAYMVFFPWGNEKTQGGKNLEGDPIMMRDEILSIKTSKTKTSSGKWNAVIAGSSNINHMVYPGCWVAIYLSNQKLNTTGGSELDSGLKMVGVVRTIRTIETTEPSTGIRSKNYIIAGDDFATVLDSPVYVNPSLATEPGGNPKLAFITKFLNPTGEIKPKSPAEIINDFLCMVFTDGKTKQAPGSDGDDKLDPILGNNFTIPANLAKYLFGINRQTNFLGFMLYARGAMPGRTDLVPNVSGTVSIWSLLKTFTNPMINEIYTDIMPRKPGKNSKRKLHPTLMLRSIPFSSIEGFPIKGCQNFAHKSWQVTEPNYLSVYVSKQIEEYEILELNHGKNDSERFNFFLVTPAQVTYDGRLEKYKKNGLIAKGGLKGLSDDVSVSRYGLRPYINSSLYVSNDESYETFNNIVKDMWQNAYLFDNGSVTIAGCHEQIPVGTTLEFKERNWIAHIESVDHTFMIDANSGRKIFRTSISFVRLCDKNGKPLFLPENDISHGEYEPAHTFQPEEAKQTQEIKGVAAASSLLSKFTKGLV